MNSGLPTYIGNWEACSGKQKRYGQGSTDLEVQIIPSPYYLKSLNFWTLSYKNFEQGGETASGARDLFNSYSWVSIFSP